MEVRWTKKQQQVIDSRNRNLLVSAAAGSGKTAVLVERIIRMISEGDKPLDIDRLLIMTFTNAAAAEMRERIGAAVDKKLTEQPDNEHLWLQAALIPQAQITTIDSFCLNLIRSHYNSLDIDPGFRIGDEGELSLLQGDVMEEMLEQCYEEGREEFGRFVEHFGRGRSDKGIEEVILQAWQFSQSHPWPKQWLEQCKEELYDDEEQIEKSPWMVFLLEDAGRRISELHEQLLEALDVCREENGPLAYEPMLMQDAQLLLRLLKAVREGGFSEFYDVLSGAGFDRLASIRSKEIDPDKKSYVSGCRDRVKKEIMKYRELYASQSPKEAFSYLKAASRPVEELLNLAWRFQEAYTAAKRQRNVLDFNDLEHLALEVLWEEVPEETPGSAFSWKGSARRPSAVADELSRQLEEILVDEYQDSNYVQEALITSISRERFGHPNVFMVGDVKQSIYRFRLAKPELFMEKYASYSREESPYQMIELQQNFRSRDTVLTAINDVFYKIMAKSLGGIDYTEETALYPGAVFAPVEEGEYPGSRAGIAVQLLAADTGKESLRALDEDALDYTAKELEARMIAGEIRRMVSREEGLLVWDKELGGYRRALFSDMVILLRSMSGWSEAFVNVLMNEGIPVLAQTRTGYFNTVEVETILSLLSVIDNPMQDIPLAAVLCSPIISMKDEEMAWFMAAYKRKPEKGQDRGVYGAWKLWQQEKPEEACEDKELQVGYAWIPRETAFHIWEKLEKLEGLLSRLRMRARELPIHELLYMVYQESGYYDYAAAMPAGEVRRANLDMLVEKAAAYEATSYKGLFHFVRYIEKLKKFDTDFGEAAPPGEKGDAVRIMSIHKSKGLEFPVVFLAGLGKRFNKQDAYGKLLLDADFGAAADYMDLELRVKSGTIKKQALKRKQELETMGEELRVLYVAMTRAKECLIMTATDRSLENKLGKWGHENLVKGRLPYTVLASANSFLDWLLMARPAIPSSHLEFREVLVSQLVGSEVERQIDRQAAREELLKLDLGQVYDEALGAEIEKALHYRYPYEYDTGLYAMTAVSELKKQSQAGRTEEAFATGSGELLGEPLLSEQSREERTPGGAFTGTAYHRALERLTFGALGSLEKTASAVKALYEQGYLDEASYQSLDPGVIWSFIKSPLGRRMAQAEAEGRIHKEQQFMMGIPACDMGKGESKELVLIQGIIDAYIEEPDGLVLIDYKNDRVPQENREFAKNILKKRYGLQLSYYEKALCQLTGKPVKQKLIYSLRLQEAIEL